MRRKIRICFIGCGRFAPAFVPLFKVHPDVEKVYVCDIRRERAEDFSQRFGVDIIESLEDALARPDINSIAIFICIASNRLNSKIFCIIWIITETSYIIISFYNMII